MDHLVRIGKNSRCVHHHPAAGQKPLFQFRANLGAEVQGIALITADHGNADQMFDWDKKNNCYKHDADGSMTKLVSHTLNPVPFIIYDPEYDNEYQLKTDKDAGLGNIAATALNLMGYEAPDDFMPALIEFSD